MTYGETFQEIKPIDDYINFNVSFFNEFREYLKEKSDLERKHAKESDILIQKFSQKLEKKKQSLNLLLNPPNAIGTGNEGSVASDSRPQTPTIHTPTMHTPQTPTTPSNEIKNKDYFSYIKAWSSLLNQMKENNNYRIKFCDKLGITIDKMKTQIVIKEDEKKNYIQNLKNINNKIEEYIVEKNNAKKKYFDSCDLLGNQKKKLTRKDSTLSDVESSTDKTAKKIDGAQIDVDNKKNLYLLSLHSLNELKKKVHSEYIPDLFNNLQECQECIIGAFQLYTQDYVKLEQKLTEDIKKNFNNALEDINNINTKKDNIDFENEKKEDIIPLEIEKFIRYFNEEGDYTITNKSSIYLSNFKDSLISQLAKDQEKFNISKSRFNNAKTLNHAANNNPSNVNCRPVMEEQTKLWNIVHMDEIPIVIKKSKIEVITGVIENEKLENPHDFKAQMFINAVCNYCHEKVRGNALKCKSCSFICHKGKCESEVPKRCTGIKVDKKLIYSSVNNSMYIPEEDTLSDNSTIDDSLNKLNESLHEKDDLTTNKEEICNKKEEQLVEDNEPSNHSREESMIVKNMSLNKKIEKTNSIRDTSIKRNESSIKRNESSIKRNESSIKRNESSIKRNESTNKKVIQLDQLNSMKDETSIRKNESTISEEGLSSKRVEQLINDDDEQLDNSSNDLPIRRNVSTNKRDEPSNNIGEEILNIKEKSSLKKSEEPDKKNEISNNMDEFSNEEDDNLLEDKEEVLKNNNSEILLTSASASSLSIASSNPSNEIAEKSSDTSFDMCAIFKFIPEHDDEVELSIGDQVKIIKQKSDGWVKVKTDHGDGYVPYNYIAPIKKALYSFNPENEDEVALKKGESVVLLGQKEAGWVKIKKGKLEGVVPESYLDM